MEVVLGLEVGVVGPDKGGDGLDEEEEGAVGEGE